MKLLLLDTDVISFILKGDSRAELYSPKLAEHQLALSFMTVAELYQWIAIRKWGPKRINQLESSLMKRFKIDSS